MIARRSIPPEHERWNERWGAPFGNRWYVWTRTAPCGRPLLDRLWFGRSLRRRGPFSLQANNTTRRAEYPWAFHAVPLREGMRVVEIGGGLSGFQFVVASLGCDVLNVDPGMESHGRGWPVDADAIDSVNRAFGTRVRLHPGFLSDAPIAERA